MQSKLHQHPHADSKPEINLEITTWKKKLLALYKVLIANLNVSVWKAESYKVRSSAMNHLIYSHCE